MKKLQHRICILATLLAVSTAWTVQAEFATPQQAQIDAAAGNSALIGSLIEGASPEQAASVVRAVVASILAQDLPAETKRSRIVAALRAAFRAMPEASRADFAKALGTEAAATLAIRDVPAIRSLVQQEIAALGGATGVNLGQIFATAYLAALDAGGMGNSDVVTPREEAGDPPAPPPPPQQPPVAPTYRGQQL